MMLRRDDVPAQKVQPLKGAETGGLMLNVAMSHREDRVTSPGSPLTCPALGDCGVPGIVLAKLVKGERGSEMFL